MPVVVSVEKRLSVTPNGFPLMSMFVSGIIGVPSILTLWLNKDEKRSVKLIYVSRLGSNCRSILAQEKPRASGAFHVMGLVFPCPKLFLATANNQWVANQVCFADTSASRNSVQCALCAIAYYEYSCRIVTIKIYCDGVELLKTLFQQPGPQPRFPNYSKTGYPVLN